MKTKTLLLLIVILFASNAFSQHRLGHQTRHGLGSQKFRSNASGNRKRSVKAVLSA